MSCPARSRMKTAAVHACGLASRPIRITRCAQTLRTTGCAQRRESRVARELFGPPIAREGANHVLYANASDHRLRAKARITGGTRTLRTTGSARRPNHGSCAKSSDHRLRTKARITGCTRTLRTTGCAQRRESGVVRERSGPPVPRESRITGCTRKLRTADCARRRESRVVRKRFGPPVAREGANHGLYAKSLGPPVPRADHGSCANASDHRLRAKAQITDCAQGCRTTGSARRRESRVVRKGFGPPVPREGANHGLYAKVSDHRFRAKARITGYARNLRTTGCADHRWCAKVSDHRFRAKARITGCARKASDDRLRAKARGPILAPGNARGTGYAPILRPRRRPLQRIFVGQRSNRVNRCRF